MDKLLEYTGAALVIGFQIGILWMCLMTAQVFFIGVDVVLR